MGRSAIPGWRHAAKSPPHCAIARLKTRVHALSGSAPHLRRADEPEQARTPGCFELFRCETAPPLARLATIRTSTSIGPPSRAIGHRHRYAGAPIQTNKQTAKGGNMVSFTLNNRQVSVDADPRTPLLWAIRDHVGL